MSQALPDQQARLNGFDISETIGRLPAPFIELGGPTPRGYEPPLIGPEKIELVYGIKTLITNIERDSRFTSEEQERIDLLVDGMDMPFDDKSIGLFFSAGLLGGTREGVLQEVLRTLTPAGIYLFQSCYSSDLYFALNIGFDLAGYSKSTDQRSMTWWNVILQKPADINQ